MRSASTLPRGAWLAAVTLLVAAWGLVAAQPAEAIGPAPMQRTYFALTLGLEDDNPFGVGVGCLAFTLTEMCPSEQPCGTWRWVAHRNGFAYRIDMEEEEVPFAVTGRARIDRVGPLNSIGGVGHLAIPDEGAANFGFTGRPMPAAECEALAESFNQLLDSAE